MSKYKSFCANKNVLVHCWLALGQLFAAFRLLLFDYRKDNLFSKSVIYS